MRTFRLFSILKAPSVPFFAFIVYIFFPSHVYSFSLGDITVKSSFGEKFHAKIIVNNDAKKGLKVFIGSPDNYATLGAIRSKTVDELYIVEPLEFVSFNQQLIKIVSDKPLFYPSFELVIKAELNGGSILEKYSLAADFKKKMTLSLSPPKSKEKASSETTKLSKAIPEEDKIEPLPPLKEKDKKLEVKKMQTPEKVEKIAKKDEIKTESPPESKEKISSETTKLLKALPEEDEVESVPPLEEKDEKFEAEEVKKMQTKPEEAEEIAKDEIATGIGVQISAEGSISYGVSHGENLSTILKKVKPQKSGFYRAVVALWRLNKDKFEHGNINDLRADARLNFDNLEEEIKKVSIKEAARTLHNHQVQWKKIRSKARPEQIAKKEVVSPVSLPGEKFAATDDVLGILSGWQHSWENKDLKKHFSYYSKDFLSHNYRKTGIDLTGWKQYKSRITEQNNNINIDIKNLHIRKEGNKIIASFVQKFVSDSLISIGTKTITFEKKNEKWKITKETFRNEETEIIYKQYPFVVHTSSHKEWAKAINAVNRLREAGFAAYLVKANIPGKGLWFRVVIDRFRSREDANLIARKLIKEGFSKYASILRLPYAISLGSFENEAKAYNSVQRFRKRKFSPYLFSRGEGKEIIHHVLVGGYVNKEQAMKVSERLSKKRVPHEVILP